VVHTDDEIAFAGMDAPTVIQFQRVWCFTLPAKQHAFLDDASRRPYWSGAEMAAHAPTLSARSGATCHRLYAVACVQCHRKNTLVTGHLYSLVSPVTSTAIFRRRKDACTERPVDKAASHAVHHAASRNISLRSEFLLAAAMFDVGFQSDGIARLPGTFP
jgi:hypothetical protein